MLRRILITISVALSGSAPLLHSQLKPEAELAAIVQRFLAKDFNTDWRGVEMLPLIRWAAQPDPLQNCLPDGNCFARQGAATIGARNFEMLAAGARTFTVNLYIHNRASAVGESAFLTVLRETGFTFNLARCPVPGASGTTNWYRLSSPTTDPGILSIQTSCNGTACEEFVISRGENLPPLQANQVSLYSEQCNAGADRKPVSTVMPHEAFGRALAALIQRAAASLPDWKAIAVLPDIKWLAAAPRRTDLTVLYNDPNPYSLTGSVTYAGRAFSAIASGSEEIAKAIHFDEVGFHAPREDVLGVLRAQGFAVELARCGPVYTESTNNWYRVTSASTKPVMLKQSLSRDGNRFHDSYALRLDGTLPIRDPRDRDPGVGGCR